MGIGVIQYIVRQYDLDPTPSQLHMNIHPLIPQPIVALAAFGSFFMHRRNVSCMLVDHHFRPRNQPHAICYCNHLVIYLP